MPKTHLSLTLRDVRRKQAQEGVRLLTQRASGVNPKRHKATRWNAVRLGVVGRLAPLRHGRGVPRQLVCGAPLVVRLRDTGALDHGEVDKNRALARDLDPDVLRATVTQPPRAQSC